MLVKLIIGRLISNGVMRDVDSSKMTSDEVLHKRKFMITDILCGSPNKNNGEHKISSRSGTPTLSAETGSEMRDSIFSK